MAWDDVKVDGSSTLPASEYNDLVAAAKHTSAQSAKWSTFDAATTYTFKIAATTKLTITSGTGITTITGGTAAGDDVTIRANASDSYPKISFNGGTTLDLYGTTGINVCIGSNNCGQFNLAGSDFQVKSISTNYNIALVPNGTGVVKFGTYTGTPVTCTGYISIQDSGGTVRRLMIG
jgi:hypothetical protein